MSFQYSILEIQDYLRLEVSGNWTPGKESEEIIRVLAEAADSCREVGATRILAVFDVPGRLQIWDAHKVAITPESFGWDHSFSLALVFLHEERFKSSLHAEMVATSRGFRVKSFRDELSAKSWLLGS